MSEVINPIATKLKLMRSKLGMTQKELADKADIPRATLAGMEREDSNPSLKAVVAVADAMGVQVDDLLNPRNAEITHVKKADMKSKSMDHGRYMSKIISPINSKDTTIIEVNLLPECAIKGTPHHKGVHEFFYSQKGDTTLVIDNETYEVKEGDLVYFPGHLPHIYCNNTNKMVTAISVLTLVE